MTTLYLKKRWPEEDKVFFLHFKDGFVVRQLELSDGQLCRLTVDEPVKGQAMLYDQKLADFEYSEEDVISQAEFESAWGGNG